MIIFLFYFRCSSLGTPSKLTIPTITESNDCQDSDCPVTISDSNFTFDSDLRESSNSLFNNTWKNNNEISDSFVVFEKNSSEKESESSNLFFKGNQSVNTCNSKKFSNFEALKSISEEKGTACDQSTGVERPILSKIYLYIQMQLCQRHSLRDWLTANKKRDYNYVLSIFEQILQAVEHVHLHGLIHRDLKVIKKIKL